MAKMHPPRRGSFFWDQNLRSRGVLIYRIGKISAADMANFSILAIGIFEIVPIFLPIFYTNTNWLILLMHCLVVTIFYCVDNHFTSFVVILLLLAMVYNEFLSYYMGKQLVMYIGSAIGIGFFLNNEYRI